MSFETRNDCRTEEGGSILSILKSVTVGFGPFLLGLNCLSDKSGSFFSEMGCCKAYIGSLLSGMTSNEGLVGGTSYIARDDCESATDA